MSGLGRERGGERASSDGGRAGHGARAGALLLVVVRAERERGRRRLQQPRTGRHPTGGRRGRRWWGAGRGGALGWRHLGAMDGGKGKGIGFAGISASRRMCWRFGHLVALAGVISNFWEAAGRGNRRLAQPTDRFACCHWEKKKFATLYFGH